MNRPSKIALALAACLVVAGLATLGLLWANRTASGSAITVTRLDPPQDRSFHLTEEDFARLPSAVRGAFVDALANGTAHRALSGAEADDGLRILGHLDDRQDRIRSNTASFRGAYLKYVFSTHD